MHFPSRWPRKKTEKLGLEKQEKSKRKILVISWWWARWTYALWIMKAMEECGVDREIDAIYWVSIGSIVWSVRATWMKAEDIFELLKSIWLSDFFWRDIFSMSGGFVSSKKIEKLLNKYLPKSFDDLKYPFHAWCVDTNNAEYKLFSEGDLPKIVLWSMSIPWIFPPVKYKNYSLIDGGALNNFPVDLAIQDYPNHEVIWIALNKFKVNQKAKAAFDNLIITFEVMMRSKLLENTKLVDYLFYRELPILELSLDKKLMKKTFDLWYEDWIKMFKKKGKKDTN